mmetsp:Transcript_11966/g.25139  ORF Transcript_11966/g.25139 Transcript_11966/m.25139 type:complete len:259 (-) Transcript_11966:289-1065(-)|eukprot:CAMPEP_0118932018 /NCGR_PEP_ID=MMETSP1169-20130426/8942_1 /TAXON_ID=36882 /ORGANISM="Pyramimonas obovata, Strain CCMP722" /LENGTH=258 /DNA_ID=CAMNT_0006874607 /DNA_START=143 /DNA_END=919 /DNA_ORIENTATION=-
MKLLCAVCENRPAATMCFAEEAAMCEDCDGRVHTCKANKHSRAQLQAPSKPAQPKCDICQDANAYVVCREDRAFLCRRCDISIHTANKLAEKHQRFLLTGVTLALHSLGSSNAEESASAYSSEEGGKCASEGEPSSSKSNNHQQLVPDLGLTTSSDNGKYGKYGKSGKWDKNMATSVPHWRVDELLDIPGLADGYSVGDTDALLGEMGDLDYDFDCLLEVPGGESSRRLDRGKTECYSSDDGLGVVPDIDHTHKRRRM